MGKELRNQPASTLNWNTSVMVLFKNPGSPKTESRRTEGIKFLKPGAAGFHFPHLVPFFSSGLHSSAFPSLLLSRNPLQVSQSYLNHQHHQIVRELLLLQVDFPGDRSAWRREWVMTTSNALSAASWAFILHDLWLCFGQVKEHFLWIV